jgi:hypothetical protein
MPTVVANFVLLFYKRSLFVLLLRTYFFIFLGGRDSLVGITTGYGLDGRGSIPGMGNIFLHSIETVPGTHPTSYMWLFPGGDAAGP